MLGTVNAVDMPVRQAFAVEMVGREDIGNAVALNSAMFNGARVIGPAVAGLAIGAFGVAAAFVINAVSFLAVIVGLLADARVRAPPGRPDRPARVGRAVMRSLREGLALRPDDPGRAARRRWSSASVGDGRHELQRSSSRRFAEDVLDSDAAGYGFLMAASGVGSLLAALWLAFGGGPRDPPDRLRAR